ncbi:heterokaryon incompatibility, partial [Cadophora sp. DSE1049]
YESLSYCWGDGGVKVPISLDGLRFEVTTNLHAALQRLRMYARTRRIWIDAICVNQRNIDERNEQVRLMRQIYTNTSRCFVWLGQFSEEKVKLGIEALTRLEHHRRADENSTKVDPAIVEAPWFSRVWVIQEITF